MASHHKPRFEKEARGKSEMAYCILPFLLSSPSSLLKLTLFKGVRGKGSHLGVPLFELNMHGPFFVDRWISMNLASPLRLCTCSRV